MKKIEFIYFDIGGVAVLDFSNSNKWKEMAGSIVVNPLEADDFIRFFGEHEPKICTGEEHVDDFIKEARKSYDMKLPDGYQMVADFVSRFEPNASIHPLITQLDDRFRLGLLTNMYIGMLDEIKRRSLLPTANWESVVDSSLVGYKKPQPEIFKLAEKMAEVAPENILFVENSLEHVQAASQRGWQTLLYDPTNLEESNQKLIEITNLG